MKIFITGASGFIGQALWRRLTQEGHELHGLFQKTPTDIDLLEGIGYVGDLMNFNLIEKFLQECNPDVIIHLAARTEVEKSFYDPIDFSLINYGGTVNLIEKAKNLSNFKLFVFASTMETYGEVYTKNICLQQNPELKPFDEWTTQYPNAPYAVAKVACEYYLRYAKRAYNFPFIALRQTNTYGRHDNNFFVVEQIITQMLENPNEINLGYAKPFRNFLYIDDLINLYSLIISTPEKLLSQNFFCIGPNNALRIEELVAIIANKLNWKGKINWDKKPKRVGEIYYLNSTNKLITSLIGWEPMTSLDEGLDKTIEIWKEKFQKI